MILNEIDYIKVIETMPIVCVDALIINEKNQYLLVKRTNEPLKDEYWLPGGRLHKNELLEESIKRKVREELGVDGKIIKLIGHFEEFFDKTSQQTNKNFHAISFVFLIEILSFNISLDNQASDWKWFNTLPDRLKLYNLI